MKTLKSQVTKLLKEYDAKIVKVESDIQELKGERRVIRQEYHFNTKKLSVAESKRLAYVQARTDIYSILDFPYPAYNPNEEEEEDFKEILNKTDWEFFVIIANELSAGNDADGIIDTIGQKLDNYGPITKDDILNRINKLWRLGLIQWVEDKETLPGKVYKTLSIVKYPELTLPLCSSIFKGRFYNKITPRPSLVHTIKDFRKSANSGYIDFNNGWFFSVMVGTEVMYSHDRLTVDNYESNKVADDATHVVYFSNFIKDYE